MPTTFSIGEFKARLPEALELVKKGRTVTVTYGRSKRPVAVFGPPRAPAKRRLGHLVGKVRATVSADWELTDDSFLGS